MRQRLIYWLLYISLLSLFNLIVGCANNTTQQPNLATTNSGRGTGGTSPRINTTPAPIAPRPTFDPISLYKGSYALLIGASEYTAGWSRLKGVEDDIPAVKQALEKHGFTVTVVLNPTKTELLKAFDEFINKYGLDKDKRLLFYYAGHGYTMNQTAGKMGYIV
ncbi:hypothetical protein TI03_05435, partial [Achromatium sp. WMS1]